jgi:hypothetical protein
MEWYLDTDKLLFLFTHTTVFIDIHVFTEISGFHGGGLLRRVGARQ